MARIVRDRDLAGEIVQSTFAKAWDELRDGRAIEHPKAWLYTVARNQSLDELRRRKRLTEDEPTLYAQPDPSRLSDPQAVAEDNELIELVWSSAAALSPDEYSLLDLHVRHGFGAADLADALDLERGAVYTRLSRLRTSLEESVTSTLLIRRGSEDCAELRAIVAEYDGEGSISPQLRRAIRAHVKQCETCKEARRRVTSPVALFGALAPVLPLAGMHEGILAAILPAGGAAAAGGGAAAATAARQGGKVKYFIAGAGGVAAVAAVVSIALSSGSVVRDPASAASVDHQVGVASTDNTVTMRWQPGKNARGYSVIFSRTRSDEPAARENVTGTQFTSAPLAPGRYWFILRSHGRDGGWTHTLRVGPFVIVAPSASAPKAVTKAKKAKAKKHAVRHAKRTVAKRPATPTAAAPAPAQVVAGDRTAPKRKPRPPTAAPKKKKKKPQKPKQTPAAPPTVVTPPPAETPPTTTAPAPVQQPVTTPPVSPPASEGEDNEHDGDGGDQGEDHGGDQGGGGNSNHGGHGHGD